MKPVRFTLKALRELESKGKIRILSNIEPVEKKVKQERQYPQVKDEWTNTLLVFDNPKLFPSTNVDRKKHWAERMPIKNILLFQIYAQKPMKHEGKVRITYTRYSTKLMDADNLGTSYKSAGDILVRIGCIVDDSPDYVEFEPKQIKVAHRNQQKITIQITDLTNEK